VREIVSIQDGNDRDQVAGDEASKLVVVLADEHDRPARLDLHFPVIFSRKHRAYAILDRIRHALPLRFRILSP